MQTTTKAYTTLSEAFDYLNLRLFENKLPELMITLHRHGRAYGYYSKDRFSSRKDSSTKVSELALNPDTFNIRTDLQILSTLAHEMTHHWQAHFGKSGKNYHNKQFADKMEEIGLQCTNNGKSDGKKTGRKMTHLIIPGGLFENVADQFLKDKKFKIEWHSGLAEEDFEPVEPGDPEDPKKTRKKKVDISKVKFSCDCGHSIRGKIFSVAICPLCSSLFNWDDPGSVKVWLRENKENEKIKMLYFKYQSNITKAKKLLGK